MRVLMRPPIGSLLEDQALLLQRNMHRPALRLRFRVPILSPATVTVLLPRVLCLCWSHLKQRREHSFQWLHVELLGNV